MVIVSETHWDREWYLPFQEFRARLVILTDKLLSILEKDPQFTNFTFDGQTIVLEDYLEVKPENHYLLQKYITERRISVGPWYVLPDEFLVSGEALVRNLMLGHKIARSFGHVMRVGYIPDPFGHIAQLPQIMQGFDIDSIIFMRGMDDSDERLGLDLEFMWDSPNKVASVFAIHLQYGYGSVAQLPTGKTNNTYQQALNKIEHLQKKLLKRSAIPILLLNNGSDHEEVQAELPAIIRNWNESAQLNEFKLVQSDFEYYIDKVRDLKLVLKRYEGEFRGSKYHPLLSSVFSARMWIKQVNTECQSLLENWAEPFAAFAWMSGQPYPQNYLWASWKWLLQNQPHDSICGCSVDEVHRDMIVRFNWAKQIAEEIAKDSMFAIFNRVQMREAMPEVIPIVVFNPLPWNRTDIASVDIMVQEEADFKFRYTLLDSAKRIVPFQVTPISERPRLQVPKSKTYRVSFLMKDLPPCGYEVLRFVPHKQAEQNKTEGSPSVLENEFYKLIIHENGTFSVQDKELQKTFENLGVIEDQGDWGDEYDYSPPQNPENDQQITNENVKAEITLFENGPVKKTVQIRYNLIIPESLAQDGKTRSTETLELPVSIFLTLYSHLKRIDLQIKLENRSKDHRIRIRFPSGLKTEQVHVDGHFFVIERPVTLPEGKNWKQPPSKTNHQQKFVSVDDSDTGITIANKGLPEYEAIREKDGSISLAITLLRCIGWLARPYLVTRKEIAGPALATPDAQCLGMHSFELSLTTHKSNFQNAQSYKVAHEFNVPLKSFNPVVMRTGIRVPDHIFFKGVPLTLQPDYAGEKWLPEKFGFLKIVPNHLILSACKKAEEDSTLILRVFNLSAESSLGIITLSKPIQTVKLVNLDEHELEDHHISELKIEKESFSFKIDGFKIATFKIFFSLSQ